MKLVSVRGNQVFDQFPNGFTLNGGQSVTVTSGPTASIGPGFLRWTNEAIWNNSGDSGQLIDDDGNIVAATGQTDGAARRRPRNQAADLPPAESATSRRAG